MGFLLTRRSRVSFEARRSRCRSLRSLSSAGRASSRLRFPLIKAGDGNRTHTSSLEGWSTTTMQLPQNLRQRDLDPLRVFFGQGWIRLSINSLTGIFSRPALAALAFPRFRSSNSRIAAGFESTREPSSWPAPCLFWTGVDSNHRSPMDDRFTVCWI